MDHSTNATTPRMASSRYRPSRSSMACFFPLAALFICRHAHVGQSTSRCLIKRDGGRQTALAPLPWQTNMSPRTPSYYLGGPQLTGPNTVGRNREACRFLCIPQVLFTLAPRNTAVVGLLWNTRPGTLLTAHVLPCLTRLLTPLNHKHIVMCGAVRVDEPRTI